ncbi:MAG: hypothetical protein MJZ81_07780 [Bacteroidales bacterium]|nr:hypothetical protein [Bacteroidales bacterium]
MMQFMKPIQVGNVILALREYVMTGKRVALKTQGEQMAIDMLIKRYDADQKAYEDKCETNKRIAEER